MKSNICRSVLIAVMLIAEVGCIVVERPRPVLTVEPAPAAVVYDAPPPAPVEVIPVAPAPGMIWIGGGYFRERGGWFYRRGYWRYR